MLAAYDSKKGSLNRFHMGRYRQVTLEICWIRHGLGCRIKGEIGNEREIKERTTDSNLLGEVRE